MAWLESLYLKPHNREELGWGYAVILRLDRTHPTGKAEPCSLSPTLGQEADARPLESSVEWKSENGSAAQCLGRASFSNPHTWILRGKVCQIFLMDHFRKPHLELFPKLLGFLIPKQVFQNARSETRKQTREGTALLLAALILIPLPRPEATHRSRQHILLTVLAQNTACHLCDDLNAC